MTQRVFKKRGRDRLYILAEILDVTIEPTPKTAIMHKANLSFSQLNSYLPLLLETQLLQRVKYGKRQLYKTSSKGQEYLVSYLTMIENLEGEKPSSRTSGTLFHIKSDLRSLQDSIKRLEISLRRWSSCPFCEADILPDFKFCPQCGKTLTESTVAASSLKRATK